jgi:DNA-binding CsgD family transcriptional regulator
MYVREADHLRGLFLLDRAAASSSRAELVASVLPILRTMFHADEVSHSEVVTRTGRIASCAGYPTASTALPGALRAYESRPLEHPWVAHVTRRRPVGTIRLTDLCSSADLRRSAFYQDFYRPRGIEHADYQTVSTSGGRTVGFGVCRKNRDFNADEHDLLEHLRRPLAGIWRLVARIEAIDAACATTPMQIPSESLTPTERRVSTLVLRGWRTLSIAESLGVSTKAVEQHLTRIYRKADVSSRAEYILRALELEQRPLGDPRN